MNTAENDPRVGVFGKESGVHSRNWCDIDSDTVLFGAMAGFARPVEDERSFLSVFHWHRNRRAGIVTA